MDRHNHGQPCTEPRWRDSLRAESSNSLFNAAPGRAEANLERSPSNLCCDGVYTCVWDKSIKTSTIPSVFNFEILSSHPKTRVAHEGILLRS